MQLFTYKKEGLSDLELFVDRVKEQGQFFLCDFRSDSMKEWEALGFNWKVGDRFLGEATSLADMTESDLHIYEGEKEVNSYESPKSMSVSVGIEPSGAGSVSPSAVKGKEGDTVTVTATPSDGYSFDHWNINDTEYRNNPQSVKLQKDMTIEAVFVQKTYSIIPTVTPSGAGSVSPSAVKGNSGASVEITATAAEGYEFSKWVIGGSDQTANPVNVTVEEGLTIQAVFTQKTYTITYVKGANIASISKESEVVAHGGVATCDATLPANTEETTYSFDGWYINESRVDPNLSLRMVDITNNITYEARGIATPVTTE